MFRKGSCCGGGANENIIGDMEKQDKEEKEKDTSDMKDDSNDYKLTYFKARIGGEMIRLILHYSGVSFEDVRVDGSDWPELKANTKWGKLPVLEFEGEKIYSSTAISRFLAKRFNLTGQNEIEAAKCDELVEVCQDLRTAWGQYFFEKDAASKAEAKKGFEIILSEYLAKFNSTCEENGNGKTSFWLVGDKISWADIFLANFLDVCVDSVDSKILDDYIALMKLKNAVFSEPNIKPYVELRPEYDH